jgi:hypothetical protein
MKRTLHAVLLGLGTLLAGACAPAITYPAEEGVMSSSSAANAPVPTLMAHAIHYAYGHWGDGGPLAINLPPGTPPSVYDRVIKLLGTGHPQEDPDDPAYHVTRVSSQMSDAMVDLFFPKPDGTYQFVTLTFHLELVGGWQHRMTRAWDTGDQPPPPGYPAAVAEAAADD